MSCASRLRTLLHQLSTIFHHNAAEVFPNKIKKPPPGLNEGNDHRQRQKAHRFHKQTVKLARKTPNRLVSSQEVDHSDTEHIPLLLGQLAKELGRFLERLNDFPMFSGMPVHASSLCCSDLSNLDDSVNGSILSFEGDLKYWSSTLSEFNGQFKFHPIGKYLHDLTCEMGGHMDSMTQSLRVFIEAGVPTIRFAQQHGTESLLNLSAVATFFSAVTATSKNVSVLIPLSLHVLKPCSSPFKTRKPRYRML
jgi:hypothetical protein